MSNLTEDDVILDLADKLSKNSPISHECLNYASQYDFLARKSYWAYEHFCTRMGHEILSPAWFQQRYLEAWSDFFLSAAQASRGQRLILPKVETQKKIFIVWHFPEYPLLLPAVRDINALVLIAQQAQWMKLAAGENHLFNFLTAKNNLQLIRAFRLNQPIVAMMDYCYENTSCSEIEFLSYKAKTPNGLIKLAKRYQYTIEIISLTDGLVQVLDSIPTPLYSMHDILSLINNLIEKAILSNPPRWLLWPSVDNRWIGVN